MASLTQKLGLYAGTFALAATSFSGFLNYMDSRMEQRHKRFAQGMNAFVIEQDLLYILGKGDDKDFVERYQRTHNEYFNLIKQPEILAEKKQFEKELANDQLYAVLGAVSILGVTAVMLGFISSIPYNKSKREQY